MICIIICISFASHSRQVADPSSNHPQPLHFQVPPPPLAGAQRGPVVGWAPPGGVPPAFPTPHLPEAKWGWGRRQVCGEFRATLPDGWQPLSVTELPRLKPLKVILLLILCGRSHSFLRETSDFHLRDAWLRLSHPKR